MGLFGNHKRRNSDRFDESQFEWKCLGELAEIRNTATSDDLIALRMTDPDDYIRWRKMNPAANPRDYFKRPGAPDLTMIRKQLEMGIIRSMLEKK